MLLVAVDDLPDDVGGLISKEQGTKNLKLKIQFRFLADLTRDSYAQLVDNVTDVSVQILKR